MASYIKTDTNVFEVVSETGEYWVVKGKRSGTTYKKYKNATTVLKQANRVRELCDEFVLIDKDGNREFVVPIGVLGKYYYKYDGGDDSYDFSNRVYELGEGEVIKGSIWTDKGLIYVAEMKKGGKLELL